jgi:hypothetical protein
MQHPTAHHPFTTDNLPWQEQLLIRLDEIVGLLDSIECHLACREKGNAGAEWQSGGCECVGCKGVGCHCTQETGHLTPTLGEEQPQ